MPRHSTWRHSITSVALFFLIFISGCSKPVVPPTQATAAKPAEEIFPLPDDSPKAILAAVKELRSKRPDFNSQRELVEYVNKMQRTMHVACDKILQQGADDQTLKETVAMKLGLLIGSAVHSEGANPAEAVKNAQQTIDQLRNDKRPAVAMTAEDFSIASHALDVPAMSSDDRTKLADEAVKRVEGSESRMLVGNVDFLAEQLLRVSENDLVFSLFTRLTKILEESSNPQRKFDSRVFKSKAKRLGLSMPGGHLELEGTFLDGKDFDWDSYRGKVVLVDYWATWCGPCVAELPNVKSRYDEYHDRGFEVLGISLDSDRKTLETFLARNPLPWPQLFDDAATKRNGIHPMAERYGIQRIPAAFLVARDGSVVSTDARGPELDALLKKLFE